MCRLTINSLHRQRRWKKVDTVFSRKAAHRSESDPVLHITIDAVFEDLVRLAMHIPLQKGWPTAPLQKKPSLRELRKKTRDFFTEIFFKVLGRKAPVGCVDRFHERVKLCPRIAAVRIEEILGKLDKLSDRQKVPRSAILDVLESLRNR